MNLDISQLEARSNSFYNVVVKRLLDVLLALFLLLWLWPLLLLIALLVVLDSGFPILYRAQRGGRHGKPFRICKFRSMVRNADQIGGGTTAFHDARITRVGSFLRKTKMDEIPQLFNILGGSMSFIGPRPELTRYTDSYDELERHILDVRPGITDFSSLEFISLDEVVGATNADEYYEKHVYKRKNALRLKYVSELSLKTDVKIFLSTLGKVANKALKVIFGSGQVA